jgi:hypothetical protein
MSKMMMMAIMTITLKLTPAQYSYIAASVAYSLTAFPPWPNREKAQKELADLFGLKQDKFDDYYFPHAPSDNDEVLD